MGAGRREPGEARSFRFAARVARWQGSAMTHGPVPTLTDGVVTLRAHRADDAPGAYEQSQDPASQRWTTVPVPYTRADARTFVGEIMPGGWADDSEWGFAIEADGRYAGTVSLRD